jgi:hypothetical protein
MVIRKKNIGGNEYYYEQRSYRDNGKVKTKHIRYIGKNPDMNVGETSYKQKGEVPKLHSPKFITSQDLLKQRGLIPPLKNKTTTLPVQFSIIVPSTKKDKPISKKAYNKRIRDTRKFLAEKFGGDTSIKAEGGYIDQKGKLIKENVTKVESFIDKKTYKEKKNELENFVQKKRKDWKQESIGFEFENDLYIYPKF